ncbi:MAG TPA: hypothetical protein DDZ51_25535 [Planctomycetaceae bacterium]|nr:hypothetical protein [Planctomycetaceae bacterium]
MDIPSHVSLSGGSNELSPGLSRKPLTTYRELICGNRVILKEVCDRHFLAVELLLGALGTLRTTRRTGRGIGKRCIANCLCEQGFQRSS